MKLLGDVIGKRVELKREVTTCGTLIPAGSQGDAKLKVIGDMGFSFVYVSFDDFEAPVGRYIMVGKPHDHLANSAVREVTG